MPYFVDFFHRSYLFNDFLILHQDTELVLHLSFPKLSKLKFKCFGSILRNFYFKWKIWKHQVTEPAMLFFVDFFPRSYLFTDLLVLHQVTELVMHLSFPNYQKWNSSVLGHFVEISSLNEKYESIRLLNFLCYFSEIVLLSSQLFVHWFVSFASSYWTCYAFEFSKLSKLKFKCFGSFLQNF